ncbi:hypothetical protein JXA80_10370 [bacterium]|nr:hypothetical protein [candidate division CSSED10-310 bacterium]
MSWIVPVVFVFGILLGGIGIWAVITGARSDQRDRSAESDLGHAVLALVRNDTESAMQNLIQLLNKSTENIDAYLALSNLYRNKGWFNRAIDIRRRLLSRSSLRPHQRRSIMLEMVRDFECAGLLDRAVTALTAVLEATDPTRLDYEYLAGLYESAGNLTAAYEAWRKAGKIENQAYIQAEQARTRLQNGDVKGARKLLGHALKLHHENPSALLTLAELTASTGKVRHAEKLYERLQLVRPDLTGVIADSIERIVTDSCDEKLLAYFLHILESQKSRPRVAVRYAAWCVRQGDLERALTLIESVKIDELAPEMMVRLIETAAACGSDAITARLSLETIHRFLDRKPFVCHNCNDLIPHLEWKCPKCGRWGQIHSRTAYAISR